MSQSSVRGGFGPMSVMQRDPRLASRYRFADALTQTGASTAPVSSPLEGLARALQGGLGGYFAGKVETEAQDRSSAASKLLGEALGKYGTDPTGALQMLGENPDTADVASQIGLARALQKPEVEKFGSPEKGVVDGRPVMFQLGDRGTKRVLDGVAPYEAAPAGFVRGPDGRLVAEPGYVEAQAAIRAAGRPVTNVSVGAENSFAKGVGEATAKALEDARLSAGSGVEIVRSSQRVQDLLDQNPITGFGADAQLWVTRALSQAGLVDGTRITTTEQLMSELANNVLAKSEQMKGVLTDRDIEFLKDASAGKLTLDAQTIRRVSELAERGGARMIERYNSLIEPVASDQRMPEATRRLYGPLQAPLREQRPPQAGAAAPGLSAEEQAELDELRKRFGR